jgi:hypothetical protein
VENLDFLVPNLRKVVNPLVYMLHAAPFCMTGMVSAPAPFCLIAVFMDSSPYIEHAVSLPFSLEPTTGTCCEYDESNP